MPVQANQKPNRCRLPIHKPQIARWLPRVSLTLWGKILVVVLECVFLGFAIYGCTKVYQDFNFREMFVPEGNWLHEAFQVRAGARANTVAH